VGSWAQKPAISNKKSHKHCRLVPKSMTLDQLKWPKCTLAEKRFTEPTRKIWKKIDPCYLLVTKKD